MPVAVKWVTVIVCLFCFWLFVPSSTTLYVRSETGERIDVEVFGVLGGWPFVSRTGDGAVRAFPLRHGPKAARIRFADGQNLWVTFFCSDVGARYRMDILVRQLPDGRVHIRQTVNSKETIFTGEVRPSDTDREHPFCLDWI